MLVASAAVAVPAAHAQVVKPKAEAVQLRVDSFAPKAGRAGSRLTITGAGFSRSTQVLFGGLRARVVKRSPTALVIAVPAGATDGQIVLRQASLGSDLTVGAFDVLVDPVIKSVSPASGAPGTAVEVRGRGFQKGDKFLVGGVEVTATVTADRAVFEIPAGATTGSVELTRPSGERAKSALKLRVMSPPPVVTGFSPSGGPPGTRVRVTGTGFTGADVVRYGAATARVLGRGPGWVDVEVPRASRDGQQFGVRGPGGSFKSVAKFELDLPPVLTRFQPLHAAPGAQVELYGSNFRDGDWVSLSGKRLKIVQLRDRQISVTVPPGIPTGPLAVGRGQVAFPAKTNLEVLNPPTLTSFMPTRGAAGAKVTLTGTYLTGADVYYGARKVKVVTAKGDGALVVEVPADARDESFRVKTRAGEAEAKKPFQVMEYALVTEVSPRTTVPGKTLLLRGKALDKADQFLLGGEPLELEHRDRTSAIVRVTRAARTSELEWVSHGQRGATKFAIQVQKAPTIRDFQPTAGGPGTEVIIRGDGIDKNTRAFFGDIELDVVRREVPGLIVVRLPRGAGGSGSLALEGFGVRTRSDQAFDVKVAPLILFALPTKALPGEHIKVHGKFFTDATEILFGRMRAKVIKREKGIMVVEVPANLPGGPQLLSARTDQLNNTWRRPFVVLAKQAAPPVVKPVAKPVAKPAAVSAGGAK
ncbi:MAG TPA: IPT/TIG domain-containing protein [Kofleriaceae bacterium]|nr:IPT/TIG domain-containing protein [Kofleriaceae bacterium]